MTTISDQNLYWLAGLLEGEGCFTHQRNKKNWYSLRIILHMTDEDVVAKAYQIFGSGHIIKRLNSQKNPKHSDSWCLEINGPRAYDWMKKLLPLMGSRRSQRIKELLTEWDSFPRKRRTPSLP